MKFQLNDNNLVTAYSEIGGVSGDIIELNKYDISINYKTGEEIKTFTSLVPTDFKDNFKPLFYKYDGEKIVKNENYVEPTTQDENEHPSPVEVLGQQVATLTLDNANMKEQNKILGQSLAELKLEVAKMKGGEV